jgi:transposase
VTKGPDLLPTDLAAAHAMILAQRQALIAAEARARVAESEAQLRALEIERLKLLLAKMRRGQYGQSSERGRRVIEQLELAITDLEETEGEEATAADLAAPPRLHPSHAEACRKPARRPFPDHLPRERIIYPAPCACPKCGGSLRKLGETVTQTLECEPRRWKVVEHVREKLPAGLARA